MNSRYRYLAPNSITFTSLVCGVISILLAASGNLQWAGILILASYTLDLFDGAVARRLNAGSAFGLQLDSLVDMVSLGTAPATLLFMHLRASGLPMLLVWPVVVVVPLSGAFRLARFNLLPPKVGSSDSMGLTISTGGATLTTAVLADMAGGGQFLPGALLILLPLLVSGLMASTIRFPPLAWVVSRRRLSLVLLAGLGASLIWWHFFQSWFILTSGYLGVSLARASYNRGR